MVVNVAVPVTVTPTGALQAMVTALNIGMDQFAFDVESQMLTSGVSAFTASASRAPHRINALSGADRPLRNTVVSSTPLLAVSASGTVITLAPAGGNVRTTTLAGATFLAEAFSCVYSSLRSGRWC